MSVFKVFEIFEIFEAFLSYVNKNYLPNSSQKFVSRHLEQKNGSNQVILLKKFCLWLKNYPRIDLKLEIRGYFIALWTFLVPTILLKLSC